VHLPSGTSLRRALRTTLPVDNELLVIGGDGDEGWPNILAYGRIGRIECIKCFCIPMTSGTKYEGHIWKRVSLTTQPLPPMLAPSRSLTYPGKHTGVPIAVAGRLEGAASAMCLPSSLLMDLRATAIVGNSLNAAIPGPKSVGPTSTPRAYIYISLSPSLPPISSSFGSRYDCRPLHGQSIHLTDDNGCSPVKMDGGNCDKDKEVRAGACAK